MADFWDEIANEGGDFGGNKRAELNGQICDFLNEMTANEKLLVLTASGASILAVVVCLLVVPQLFFDINQILDEVRDGVQVFRVETDSAWTQLMQVQLRHTPPSPARQNPFESIFQRAKRQQDYSSLPAWCQCEPIKPQCPPGPPGPPGESGQDGQPGEIGPPGEDNTNVYPQTTCPAPDTSQCIQCPAGPPGPQGGIGNEGPPGAEGQPGGPGQPGKPGQPGEQGPAGDSGQPGEAGQPGQPGTPGSDAENSPALPGPKGPPGAPGQPGQPGGVGQAGQEGAPGEQGPPGPAGIPGQPGTIGQPGGPGPAGLPGHDAAYCPCPTRSAVFRRQ